MVRAERQHRLAPLQSSAGRGASLPGLSKAGLQARGARRTAQGQSLVGPGVSGAVLPALPQPPDHLGARWEPGLTSEKPEVRAGIQPQDWSLESGSRMGLRTAGVDGVGPPGEPGRSWCRVSKHAGTRTSPRPQHSL